MFRNIVLPSSSRSSIFKVKQLIQKIRRWSHYNPPKRRKLFTSRRSVTQQKTSIFSNTAVRPSNLDSYLKVFIRRIVDGMPQHNNAFPQGNPLFPVNSPFMILENDLPACYNLHKKKEVRASGWRKCKRGVNNTVRLLSAVETGMCIASWAHSQAPRKTMKKTIYR
jgi:hypothetical protein